MSAYFYNTCSDSRSSTPLADRTCCLESSVAEHMCTFNLQYQLRFIQVMPNRQQQESTTGQRFVSTQSSLRLCFTTLETQVYYPRLRGPSTSASLTSKLHQVPNTSSSYLYQTVFMGRVPSCARRDKTTCHAASVIIEQYSVNDFLSHGTIDVPWSNM